MHTIQVNLKQNNYPIYISQQLLTQADVWQKHIVGQQVCIVTNETIAPHYLSCCENSLAQYHCDTVILPDGEQYKTQQTLARVWDALIEHHHHRDTTLLALGGGVVGDMAGFAAACYQRGVAVIQMPTSLLAQVDAAIGGKTGVNHPQGKNMIGAFHQPRCVVIDLDTLKTLPEREYTAGLAEVIKYALLGDAKFFEWLTENMPALLARNGAALTHAVQTSCQHKARIVAADEREQGQRMLLNLGHTFGHAIETLTDYSQFLHGEAVAIGLNLAAVLSARMGFLSVAEVDAIQQLLVAAKLPITCPESLSVAQILRAMQNDKKIAANRLRFILLRGIGHAFASAEVTPEQVRDVL